MSGNTKKRILHLATLPLVIALLVLGCQDEQSIPVAPDSATADAERGLVASAKPDCNADPPHPSCDGGGDTVELRGNYSTDTPQPVDVGDGGKYLRVEADDTNPIEIDLDLPEIAASDIDGDIDEVKCWQVGFSGADAAADFWNDHRTMGGPDRRLRIQVDKKSLGESSSMHFTQVFFTTPEGVTMEMRDGNDDVHGPATWTIKKDPEDPDGSSYYKLTGGGVSFRDIFGERKVSCNADADKLGTAFIFELL